MKNSVLFALLVVSLFIGCTDSSKRKVGLQPYHPFPLLLSDTIASAVQREYDMPVQVLNYQMLPQASFIDSKIPRYRADSLIRFLKRDKPDSFDYIIGLTDRDISFTKKDAEGHTKQPENTYSDWGIFGLGYVPGTSCIVSSFRLHHKDETVFISRLKKVAIHELGHNLGLPHCDSKHCVMQDAVETIRTIDAASIHLCAHCKNKLP